MANYDFSNLGPREFEHLVQALATHVVASGVRVFGDGPDGGREATFEGRMDYPSKTAPWDGYLVIQCKAKVRPTHEPKTDGAWAILEFRKELEAWVNRPRPKRPDYFIAVTNVVLTAAGARPVPAKVSKLKSKKAGKTGEGGKDKLCALLEEFAPRLGLKGYSVWDADQIGRYLDANADVRKAYAPFILLGDVLHDVCSTFGKLPPDFECTMASFLQTELLADEYARLEQAGHAFGARASLGNVYTEIDASTHPAITFSSGILARLVRVGAEGLCDTEEGAEPLSKNLDNEVAVSANALARRPLRGRFVLVGGPGQGKSTIGQFLCQLYRAALLRERKPLEVDASRALKCLLEQAEANQIQLPTTRRFPMRVELSAFASQLAEKKTSSLLQYLAERIRLRTDTGVDCDVLRTWLGLYPWLLVLDGLDEVPCTSNRTQVLEAIQQFWVTAADVKADLQVVATTRPQGYGGEFSEELYQHWYLAPLTLNRALQYGKRLCEAKHPHNRDLATEVYNRLAAAAAESSSLQKLLKTPLQVTMLVALSEQFGTPPQQRWRLFHEYYRLVYQREVGKNNPTSALLRIHYNDVEAIHRTTALLLQLQSEQAGKTDATVTADELERIIQRRLACEGLTGMQGVDLARNLVRAAMERLVLLVAVRTDRIGFELRPLQEYMAAEAMLGVADEMVMARLTAMGLAAHWHQVFMFAAGKCFVDVSAERFRDKIVDVCRELNKTTVVPAAEYVRLGSRLALEMIEDEIVRPGTRFHKLLVRLALELLSLPPDPVHHRLAVICHESVVTEFQDALTAHQGDGAWTVLLGLVERGWDWAVAAAETRWACEKNRASVLLSSQCSLASTWALSKVAEVLPFEKPYKFASEVQIDLDGDLNLPSWLRAALVVSRSRRGELEAKVQVRLNGGEASMWLVNRSIPRDRLEGLAHLQEMPRGEVEWIPLRESIAFARNPTKEQLVTSLERVLGEWNRAEHGYLFHRVPWQLDACLQAEYISVETLVERAQSGILGDFANWSAAENRWRSAGVSEHDLMAMTAERWPYDSTIAECGIPLDSFFPSFSLAHGNGLIGALLDLHTACRQPLRPVVGDWIVHLLANAGLNSVGLSPRPSAATLQKCFEEQPSLEVHMPCFAPFDWSSEFDENWVDFFDWLGRQKKHFYYYDKGHSEALSVALAQAFTLDSNRVGLLHVLALLVLQGGKVQVSRSQLEPLYAADPRYSEAAMLVRLAVPDWERAEGQALGKLAAKLSEASPSLPRSIVEVFRAQNSPFEKASWVTLSMLDGASGNGGGRVFSVSHEWLVEAAQANSPALGATGFDLDLPEQNE